jgi:predicted RNA methylase
VKSALHCCVLSLSEAERLRGIAIREGVAVGSQGGRPGKGENPVTVAEFARAWGHAPRTLQRRWNTAWILRDHPDLYLKVDHGEMEEKRALKIVRSRARVRLANQPAARGRKGIRLYQCDFRDLRQRVRPGSVNLILTDPPWEEHPLARDLGKLALDSLAPDGLLLVIMGHAWLPEWMRGLSEFLDYLWIGVMYNTQKSYLFHPGKVRSHTKPILAYEPSGGRRVRQLWISDFFEALEPDDKTLHDHQRSLSAVREMVTKCSRDGDLVVDPFFGSGTTAVACRELGRRFVGCDIDPENVAIAKARLERDEVS